MKAEVTTARLLLWPGLEETGLVAQQGRQPGPASRGLDFDQLVELCERTDLRGRGGAGFPLARKLRAVRAAALSAGVAPHVVANGEEGEPASVKDRLLLARCPDLVLDGAELVARALDAERVHLYISDQDCRRIVSRRLGLRVGSSSMEVFAAPAGYVCGEESAVVRALSGGPAKPTAKPPRPFEHGVLGRPTLVSNVETLAQLANTVLQETRTGIAAGPTSTVLLTVVTDLGVRTLVECPDDVNLRAVLTRLGLWPTDGLPELILGGFFGAFATAASLAAPLRHQAIRAVGASLGCGVVLVLTDTCPVTAVAEILHYLDGENAHQCGPCFRGIAGMLAGVESLANGSSTASTVERLQTWAVSLRGRGACGTLDAAAGLLDSLLTQHHALITTHLRSTCQRCATAAAYVPGTRWASSHAVEATEL